MGAQPATFRDFGILPDQLQPPAEAVRGYLSAGRIAGQFAGTLIVAAVGLGAAALCFYVAPAPLQVVGALTVLVGFAAFLYRATRHDYRAVELVGDRLRATHLYTQQTLERPVSEIARLLTILHPGDDLSAAIVENLFGRVKGVEIQFRDGCTPLRILRSDPALTNAQALMEGVAYRLSQLGELDAEVVTYNGRPLLRTIHFVGEPPAPPARGNSLVITLVCVLGMALVFGVILSGITGQELEQLRLVSQPPQVLTLTELVAHGPGANRHLTLTEFQPGGYVVESENGRWRTVYVALFEPGRQAAEIPVVVSTTAPRSEPELAQLVQAGRLTVICSAEHDRHWGLTLGPELVQANDNLPLVAAWSLKHVVRPPSPTAIAAAHYGAYACFVAALGLALALFWAP